ncbi:MAG: DUF5658 family protein [Caulobacterales bacterium]
MEAIAVAVAAAAGCADAVTTKIALKRANFEETNPLVRFLFAKLPWPTFILVMITTCAALCGLSLFVFGPIGQIVVAALLWLPTIHNLRGLHR